MPQWKLLAYDAVFALKEYVWAGGLIFALSFFYDTSFSIKVSVISIVFLMTFMPFYLFIVLIRAFSKHTNYPAELPAYLKYYEDNIWWF
jgi:hypothetical protein